jgi:heme O synthase-like polyprenyltransferase
VIDEPPEKAAAGMIARPTRMKDYIELTKPRITWLILMSTGIGYFFGLPKAGSWCCTQSWAPD